MILAIFHLDENATSNVVTQTRGVSDSECYRTFDGHLARLTAIKFFHSLYFRESSQSRVFETMTGLI